MATEDGMRTRFEEFVATIGAIGKDIQRIKSNEMQRFGLRGTDVMCLYYLEREPEGLPAATLARLAEVDRAAVSRTVSWLEDGGFVETRQVVGSSRYRAPIVLTDKGTRVTAEVDQTIDEVMAVASAGVSAADREAMYRALRTIRTNLERIGEKGGEA